LARLYQASSDDVPGGNVARQDPEDDREKRIEDLKRRAEELCGGQIEVGGPNDCSSEMEEAFWKGVVDYEEAPWTTHFHQLESAGVSLPPPDSLNDQELSIKLWDLIHKLALLRVFIEQTDHLSDRELYSHLWTDSLREETKALPPDPDSAWHIQLLSSGSEEDNQLYLKYYADDDWRRHWHKDFPNDPIPAHEDPPYDRDRLLPRPDYSQPVSRETN
jgi:hypothetical protein